MGMSRLLWLTLLMLSGLLLVPASPRDPDMQKFVNSKLASMSLKEQIGQMTQVDISYFLQKDQHGNPVAALNTDLLAKVVSEYGIGSIANSPFAGGMMPLTPGGPLVSGFNVTQWIEFTNIIQKIALSGNSSVPILYYVDHIHGANYVYGATIFPHSVALAATWNPSLVAKVATITAKDSRTANLPWVGSPVLNVALNPLWPDMYSTFGEDPYLISQLAIASVLGLQGNTSLTPTPLSTTIKVAAMLKHFIGNGDPNSGKINSASWISIRMLTRYFLPAFQAAVNAGATSVMSSPGAIDGVPVPASSELLQGLLRQMLKFDGLVCSGPDGVSNLESLHHVAISFEKAVAMAVNAGIQMSQSTQDLSFADTLYSLAQKDDSLQQLISQAAGNILALKKSLGLFENPYGSMSNPNVPTVGSNADGEFAIQVARESVTLLKNDGILPLNKTFKNIVLSGPAGNTVGGLSGGYTFHERGSSETEWSVYPFSATLLLNINTVAQTMGVSNVGYSLGCNFTTCNDAILAEAYNLAQKADLLVLTVGEDTVSGYGDIDSLELSDSQVYLMRNMSSLGKPMIIVLVEGRPRILPQFVVDAANAIIHAYLPGPQGGLAVAEVMWGITNPSGKLPFTYHSRTGDIRVPYYHPYSDSTTPLYPFGFGLSFTNFEYSELTMSANVITIGQSIDVRVKVKNAGHIPGLEVVQLYLSDVFASVTPEVRMLRRFQKVNLTAGQSTVVEFTLNADDMSFIGIDNKPTIEPGVFTVSVGSLQASFNVTSPSGMSIADRRHNLVAEYERKQLELALALKRQLAALEDDANVQM